MAKRMNKNGKRQTSTITNSLIVPLMLHRRVIDYSLLKYRLVLSTKVVSQRTLMKERKLYESMLRLTVNYITVIECDHFAAKEAEKNVSNRKGQRSSKRSPGYMT